MINEELIQKINLHCVYDDTIYRNKINRNKCYVYLIILSDDKYYVGATERLLCRIKEHLGTKDIKKIYILEELNNKYEIFRMEKIWIIWFKLNSCTCINIVTGSIFIREGRLTIYDTLKTNYYTLLKNETIIGIRLLKDIKKYNIEDEVNYFGKTLN